MGTMITEYEIGFKNGVVKLVKRNGPQGAGRVQQR
jgi:hypothetical protein